MGVYSNEKDFLYKICFFVIDGMQRDGIISRKEADAAISELINTYRPGGGEEDKEKSSGLLQGIHRA